MNRCCALAMVSVLGSGAVAQAQAGAPESAETRITRLERQIESMREDLDALRKVFADADANGWFIEAMFLEPVMGEGDPGRSVPRDFYDAARELTTAHGALLLVDSIQAGLRATGYASIVD